MVARTPNKAKKKRIAGPTKANKPKAKAKAKAKGKAKAAHGPKANRQVKSYMFATIFGELESLIGLVNAVAGTKFGPDTPAEIATLKNVLSTGPLNDLAIILNDTLLVLVEHQSTDNPNMAYQMLEYVVEIYKRRTANEDLYSTAQVALPRPIFVVLYHGPKKLPARELQRLSSAFPKTLPEFAGLGSLELTVMVINMNDPSNKTMIKTCKLLNEYSIFVNKLTRNRKTMGADRALNKTVDECIAQGVLKNFLLKHKKELIMGTMLVKDWDWDMAMKVAGRENFEMGFEKGEARGEARGVKKGIGLGVKRGLTLGRKEGIGLGRKEGIEAERARIANLIKRGASLDSIKQALLKQRAPRKRQA